MSNKKGKGNGRRSSSYRDYDRYKQQTTNSAETAAMQDMRKRYADFGKKITDPRAIPGDMAGPGGPHDRQSIVIDSTNAILLDASSVALIALTRKGEPVEPQVQAIALMLSGRINRTEEQARTVYIMTADGAAALISELVALLGRADFVNADELFTTLLDRVHQLRAESNLAPLKGES